MRILHSESSTGWGGQENRTLNELIGMRERGHEMAVVSRPGARILERAKEAGFETFAVDMRGALDFPALFKLRRLMREFRADIVNTHSGRDTQLAGMAARSMGSQRPRIVRTRHLALQKKTKIHCFRTPLRIKVPYIVPYHEVFMSYVLAFSALLMMCSSSISTAGCSGS